MSANIESAKVYTDFSGFDALRAAARKDQQQALPEVAKQFEAIFLQMVIKSMREAGKSLAENGLFKSDAQDFYQDMSDQQLSLSLSGGKGIGLANVLVRQLGGNGTVDNQQENLKDKELKLKQLPATSFLDTIKSQLSKAAQMNVKGTNMSEQLSTAGSAVELMSKPMEFIKSLLPYAEKFAKAIGLDPKMLVAQAALETGWGKAIIHDKNGDSSHNLFNIKTGSKWQKDHVTIATTEYEQGKAVKRMEPFRKYESYGESFADYINLLTSNKRFDAALKNTADPQAYIQSLQDAGYATDPNYAKKIYSIYKSDILNELIIGNNNDG